MQLWPEKKMPFIAESLLLVRPRVIGIAVSTGRVGLGGWNFRVCEGNTKSSVSIFQPPNSACQGVVIALSLDFETL